MAETARSQPKVVHRMVFHVVQSDKRRIGVRALRIRIDRQTCSSYIPPRDSRLIDGIATNPIHRLALCEFFLTRVRTRCA